MDEQAKRLLQIMDKIKRLHQHRMDMNGLHKGEFMMLMSIREYGKFCLRQTGEDRGATVSELSRMHRISPPAISQMMRGLEQKGMVSRIPSKEDRRVVRICLTPLGEETVSTANEKFLRFTSLILERLGKEDTEKMLELFDKLYTIVEEIEQTGDHAEQQPRPHVRQSRGRERFPRGRVRE